MYVNELKLIYGLLPDSIVLDAFWPKTTLYLLVLKSISCMCVLYKRFSQSDWLSQFRENPQKNPSLGKIREKNIQQR
jgi:hypothetical protein